MFLLYLSHLQALKGQMHIISEQCIVGSPALTKIRLYNNITISSLYHQIIVKRWGSHNALFTYCMDLTLEGLRMTQVESKHVALLM
jgi:hypothetical protein